MNLLHLSKSEKALLLQRLFKKVLLVGMFSVMMNSNTSKALQPHCLQHPSSSYDSYSLSRIIVSSCAVTKTWDTNDRGSSLLRLSASTSESDHLLGDKDEEVAMLPNLDWPMSMDQPNSAVEESIQDGDRIRKFLELRSNRGKVVSSSSVMEPTNPISNWAASTPSSSESLSTSKKTKKSKKQESRKSRKAPPKTLTLYTGCTIRRDLPYESTLEALKTFHQQECHLVLPRKFVVPITDTCDSKKQEESVAGNNHRKHSYPEEWQGADLAGTVYDMKWWTRHIKHRPDRVADLNRLGFIWERIQPEWNLVLEALVTYGILHGNLLVPVKFVIPHNDTNYPRATWGIPLGTRVYRIRNRNDFLHGQTAVSRRNQLDSLGFVWDVREHQFNTFCQALILYAKLELPDHSDHNTNVRDPSNRQLKGALRIPAKYVVPKLPSWPKELWGYPLGAKCTAVRQKQLYVKGQPGRLRILAELGFHDGGNDALSWLEVVHAAAVFSQMNNRKLDVPAKFVVPAPPRSSTEAIGDMEEAWPWPDCLWGLPLGQRLRDIRLRGYYLRGELAQARRQQLDTLGFEWNPKRGRRPSVSKARTKQKTS